MRDLLRALADLHGFPFPQKDLQEEIQKFSRCGLGRRLNIFHKDISLGMLFS
jgi:hypothetical protein